MQRLFLLGICAFGGTEVFNSKDFYRPGRTGKPDKYEKVPDTKASKVQVGRAGQTNTKSFECKSLKSSSRKGRPDEYEKLRVQKPQNRVQKPQKLKSEGQARRIRKSFECKSLKSSSRTGRPDEYEKAPGTKLPMYKPKRQAVKTMYPINYNIELITHMNYKVFDS